MFKPSKSIMLSSLLSGVQILIDTCSSKGQNVHVCLFVCLFLLLF